MFERMLSRVFPCLLAAVICFGCVESKPDGSSTSTSGEMPVPPPMKVVWTATSMTDAPSARHSHTAVWTGSKMIIWGGNTGAMPLVTNTGAVYDPTTDTWKPTSLSGAPTARAAHNAVWTGSKMLVWGGFGVTNLEPAGAAYDPATDTWSPMSTTNQPELRSVPAVVWSGSKLIVWGGRIGSPAIASGGMYDLATDTWTLLNAAGAPSARYFHPAEWSGTRMLVWGGSDTADWTNTGAFFDPAGGPTGVWTNTSSTTGAPRARDRHTLSFTGKSFVAWGGWDGGLTLNTGGMLDPEANKWTEMSKTGAPTPRTNHVGIWAGGHEFVWGGCGEDLCDSSNITADGGQFVPDSMGGTWYPIDTQAALAARYSPTAVYTGDGVIVWGGRLDPQTRTNTGAFTPL